MRSSTAAVPSHFDLTMAAFNTWLVAGIFTDGWHHGHEGIEVESFFTPWHALLYSGFIVGAIYMAAIIWRRRRPGEDWRRAVPDGYGLYVLGGVVFFISGLGDMLWHTFLGIEKSISAGFSPSHLGIMTGTAMMLIAPIRATWRRSSDPGRWIDWLPLLLSLELTVSLMTFYTQYANPEVVLEATRFPSGHNNQALGAISIELTTAIFMGWILIALQRWSLPPGSLTFILGMNAVSMSPMSMQPHFFMIPAAVVAGAAADVLMVRLQPRPVRPFRFHEFAFLAPLPYYALYFVTLFAVSRVSWPIPLWTGSVFMAGLISLLLSFLIVPATFTRPRVAASTR